LFPPSLPTIGTLTIDVTNFLTLHPSLIHEVAGHGLAHALYSHMRRGSRGLSRRKARKLSNRKRRWFVDNIIMHHKRLHDRNRELAVSNARNRALARRKALEKKPTQINSSPLQHSRDDSKWRTKVQLKDRGAELRSRSHARKIRAESRWATLIRSAQDDANMSAS
jgi:hypothetical protein